MSALAQFTAFDELDEAPQISSASNLDGYRDELNATIGGIEKIFTAIGERLIGCAGLLGDMQSAFAAVTEAHNSPELASANDAIRALVGECAHLIARLQQERGLTQSLTRTVTAAAPQIDDLRQTVSMIAAIAVNARVIAAGMRKEGNSDLTVFTDDVLELSRRASNVVDRLQAGQTQLRTVLLDATQRNQSFEENFRKAAQRLEQRIEADIVAADAERDKAGQVSTSAADATASLAQEASSIVASMQIGDNTRQRLEHVSAALAMIAEEPAARSAVLGLQVAQIGSTREKLAEEFASMREAILVLSGGIDRTFTTLSTELEGGRKKGSNGAERLAVGVEQAAAELSRSEVEHRHVVALAEQLRRELETFGACSNEMQMLEFEMRLVSLNTAITCSKLGEAGKALGVVSQQMRELVAEMVVRSKAVAMALSELGTIADEMAEIQKRSAERSLATLVEDAERSLKSLRAADGKLQGAGNVLGNLGTRIAGLTHDAGAVLDRLQGLSEKLSAIETDLATQLPDGRNLGEDDMTRHEDLLARLRAAYTMEAERQIHDCVLSAFMPDTGGHGDAAPTEEAKAADDLDSILF
ncbi:hypothetical protein [Fulvimarina sp. MAC8]|uniref:hypothetical protein n=1 Tax=Fulvimarina sp. MAC8 TaxID=3162874 RepID=UPI0032EE88DF